MASAHAGYHCESRGRLRSRVGVGPRLHCVMAGDQEGFEQDHFALEPATVCPGIGGRVVAQWGGAEAVTVLAPYPPVRAVLACGVCALASTTPSVAATSVVQIAGWVGRSARAESSAESCRRSLADPSPAEVSVAGRAPAARLTRADSDARDGGGSLAPAPGCAASLLSRRLGGAEVSALGASAAAAPGRRAAPQHVAALASGHPVLRRPGIRPSSCRIR